MGGAPGLRVCPGTLKTAIMLMIIRDSSIRAFVLFINCSALCVAFGRRQRVLASSNPIQIKGRSDHSPWGKSLPCLELKEFSLPAQMFPVAGCKLRVAGQAPPAPRRSAWLRLRRAEGYGRHRPPKTGSSEGWALSRRRSLPQVAVAIPITRHTERAIDRYPLFRNNQWGKHPIAPVRFYV